MFRKKTRKNVVQHNEITLALMEGRVIENELRFVLNHANIIATPL